jgi:hypothetical protein
VSPVRYERVFISQKTAFFIVTAVKTSNLTKKTTFRRPGLFQSSRERKETPTLLGSLENANLSHWAQESRYSLTLSEEGNIQFPKRRVF